MKHRYQCLAMALANFGVVGLLFGQVLWDWYRAHEAADQIAAKIVTELMLPLGGIVVALNLWFGFMMILASKK